MHILLVEVHVKPGMRDKFLEVIRYDATHSEGDEPGCVRFDVLQDTENEDTFFFYEVYKDQDATLAHRAAPHYKVWADASPDLIDTATTVRHVVRNAHPLDDAWR